MERPNIYINPTVGHRIRLLLFLVSVLYFLTFIIPNMVCAWELAKKQNGITVYTRKVKGSDFKEYKAVANIKASLSSMVAIVDDVEAYPSWIHTCKEGKLLKRVNEKETVSQCHSEAIAEESDLRQQVILTPDQVGGKDLVPIAWIPRHARDDALHRISPFHPP